MMLLERKLREHLERRGSCSKLSGSLDDGGGAGIGRHFVKIVSVLGILRVK